ncbi:MAG TPA: DUF4167 domain-containing protein [Caulobacteraceae bacterium]|nr:DUF4167 domain-containing protein [Caulobacteraceae bacterium]
MRDFKGMKRQRSRNRGGGGGKPQHNANRAFESNGPDGVKIRGAAQHVFEKYQQLARDALTAGDRVLAENYQQHAEHYFRVLRAVQPQRAPSDIMGRDAFASGFDIDFEDESGQQQQPDAESGQDGGDADGERGEWRQDGQRYEARQNDRQRNNGYRDDRNGGYRDDRPRDDRPRDDRPRDDRPREERPRDDRPRDDRPRDDRPRDDRPREDRFRDDRQRGDRYRDDRRYDRNDRPADPLAVVEPQATPLTAAEAASPILRSQDGGVSQAPAFLQARSAPEAGDEAVGEARPRGRRRRGPRGFDDATGGESPDSTAEAAEEA